MNSHFNIPHKKLLTTNSQPCVTFPCFICLGRRWIHRRSKKTYPLLSATEVGTKLGSAIPWLHDFYFPSSVSWFQLTFPFEIHCTSSRLLLFLSFMKKWLNNIYSPSQDWTGPETSRDPIDGSQKTPLADSAHSSHFSWTRTSLKPTAFPLFHPRNYYQCILHGTCDEVKVLSCESKQLPVMHSTCVLQISLWCQIPVFLQVLFLLSIRKQRSH